MLAYSHDDNDDDELKKTFLLLILSYCLTLLSLYKMDVVLFICRTYFCVLFESHYINTIITKKDNHIDAKQALFVSQEPITNFEKKIQTRILYRRNDEMEDRRLAQRLIKCNT